MAPRLQFRAREKEFFRRADLSYKAHSNEIEVEEVSSLDISSMNYVDNNDEGAIDVDVSKVVKKGDKFEIEVRRVGGSRGDMSVHVSTNDGNATFGTHYEAFSGDITFKENETMNTITIITIYYDSKESNQVEFSLSLSKIKESDISNINPMNKTIITIVDEYTPPAGLVYVECTKLKKSSTSN